MRLKERYHLFSLLQNNKMVKSLRLMGYLHLKCIILTIGAFLLILLSTFQLVETFSAEQVEDSNMVDDFFFDVDKIQYKSFDKSIEFHGFIKLGWPINNHNQNSNIFDETDLTLWFGTDVFKNITFTSELEIEEGFDVFELEMFEFNWQILNDNLNLKVGKFIYPFGIERFVEDSTTNKLSSRPIPFKSIIPGTYSDNGLQVFGTLPFISTVQLRYEIAVTTGLSDPDKTGEQDLSENNDNKTLGGRLGFIIFPGLEIGSSYSNGKYDDNDKLRMDFFGFDLAFKKGGFEFRGEYIHSNVEEDNIETSSYNRDGYYAQISYKYMPISNYFRSIEGITRFDTVDPNDIVTDKNDTNRISFGLNCEPMEHLMFKLEYMLENPAKGNLEKNLIFETIFRW